jgi:hypothetical protein
MRWLDDVEDDLKKVEVKGWKEKMRYKVTNRHEVISEYDLA